MEEEGNSGDDEVCWGDAIAQLELAVAQSKKDVVLRQYDKGDRGERAARRGHGGPTL